MRRILVVDDEAGVRYALEALFERAGYQVRSFTAARAALDFFRSQPDDWPVILTDYTMPEMNGLEFLQVLRETSATVTVIMLTAHGSESVAVEAMKCGARDYFTKPFQNDELLLKVDAAFREREMQQEVHYLRERCREGFRSSRLISVSPVMHGLMDKLDRVAATDVTVLVTGESGTGKELVAREIQARGQRQSGPFIALNCAAIPRDLLENELFGHEKGAYTGADALYRGKFELADGGTLFLDEVGDMPMTTQAKLLRAIQERQIERVGGSGVIPVDVRIIAATNRDLKQRIDEGEFREDLYYRLNVISLALPPLRNRREDISVLLEHFLKQFSEKLGRRVDGFTNDALEYLGGYPWPGNVRQLQNTVERILVLSDRSPLDLETVIECGELPPVAGLKDTSSVSEDLFELEFKEAQREVLARFEKRYLERHLRRHGGNISRTAAGIGVHRTHLHDKIREHEIDIDRIKQEERG